jgi:ATP-dependent Clp protease ATP-binding subunit ClpC
VVDVEGDPADIDKSHLVFRGTTKPAEVPDAVPADLSAGEATE